MHNPSRQADEKIEYLSTGTDGKSFFVDENDVSQGLSNAFIGSLIYEPAVRSEDTTVKVFLTISYHFYFFKLM